MGFFDHLRLPGKEDDDEDDLSTPEWLEAPDDVVAGVVAVEAVLARSDKAAVLVTRLAAHPVGFEFDVELLTCERMPEEPFDLMYGATARPGRKLPPELVRIGIEFPDGRRATSFSVWGE
ncbi:MAG TPA: hypothetical protein VK919_07645 [Solirubrobacterales bacterium]|nr:hypothetical protein [Solirubrobacterales bacterium]